jgi:menaquinone-9 beta-reductase
VVSTDVFVVGGGPAGLAAAIAARQHGFRVMVADCFHPPIDKACGEGLMPGAAAALHALGVDLDGSVCGGFRGIRFIGPDNSATAEFPAEPGIAIRRTLLHQRLVERTREAGVEMLWDTRVSGLRDGSVVVEGNAVRCEWVIGADGQNSQVRRWAGLSAAREPSCRIGLRQHFRVAPWSEFVEVYWGDEGQMYVTPVSANETGVALLSKERFASFDAALGNFDALARRLQGAERSSAVKGAATVTRRLKSVCRGRVALVGDASGSVDAITGDGLAISFHQAVALGEALDANDLRRYQAAHRQIAAVPQLMGRMLLLMDKSSWLRRRALRAFAGNPGLLRRLLSVHVGDASVSAGVVHLGWELLKSSEL